VSEDLSADCATSLATLYDPARREAAGPATGMLEQVVVRNIVGRCGCVFTPTAPVS